jgi:type II secretory ATPase GspE/PulE/Tfp pilus assembly ATPase PilB-like protein
MVTNKWSVAQNDNIQASDDGIKSAKDLAKRSSEEARQYIPVELAFRLKSLPLSALLKNNTIYLTVAIPIQKQNTILLEQELIVEAIFDAYYGGVTVFPGVLPDSNLNNSSNQSSYQNISKEGDNFIDKKEFVNSVICQAMPLKLEQLDLLDKLLYYAVARHASDLHLTPADNGYFVRLRVDGELLSHRTPLSDSVIYKKMVRRLKLLGGLSLSPSTQPEESSFQYALPNKQIV